MHITIQAHTPDLLPDQVGHSSISLTARIERSRSPTYSRIGSVIQAVLDGRWIHWRLDPDLLPDQVGYSSAKG